LRGDNEGKRQKGSTEGRDILHLRSEKHRKVVLWQYHALAGNKSKKWKEHTGSRHKLNRGELNRKKVTERKDTYTWEKRTIIQLRKGPLGVKVIHGDVGHLVYRHFLRNTREA